MVQQQPSLPDFVKNSISQGLSVCLVGSLGSMISLYSLLNAESLTFGFIAALAFGLCTSSVLFALSLVVLIEGTYEKGTTIDDLKKRFNHLGMIMFTFTVFGFIFSIISLLDGLKFGQILLIGGSQMLTLTYIVILCRRFFSS